MSDYTIPTEIKEKLTDEFYSTMWEELVKEFGDDIKGFDESYDGKAVYPSVYLYESTSGWRDAFYRTCEKLNLQDVREYWDSLEWDDSDKFDGEISEGLAKRFSRKTNADKIRSMSDEELAEMLNKPIGYACDDNCHIEEDKCVDCIVKWLKEEVDE